MSRQMTLIELADGFFDVSGHADCSVTGMTADSRALQPGDAFIAVQGLTAHGLSYLRAEQAAKASVVLYEAPAPASTFIPENAIAVPALKSLQAGIASRFFGAPAQAMTMVGVTGTNGKTSTVQLIAQAFTLQGRTGRWPTCIRPARKRGRWKCLRTHWIRAAWKRSPSILPYSAT